MQAVILKMTAYLSASCHEPLSQAQLLRLDDPNTLLNVSKATIEKCKQYDTEVDSCLGLLDSCLGLLDSYKTLIKFK